MTVELTATEWATVSAVTICLALVSVVGWARQMQVQQQTERRLRWLAGQPLQRRRFELPSLTRTVRNWRNTQSAAALRLRLEEYWIAVALAALAGALIGGLTRGLVGAVILGAVGAGGTLYYFQWRRQQFLQRAESQLPDFLRGLSTAMRAGSSFAQALTLVGQEFPDPLGREVQRLSRREALGATLEDALSELAERVPSKDLQLAIIAIQTQREVGGALSPLLESVVETLAQRQALKAEVRTLTAQGRASGTVLTLLPIGLGLLIWFINPTYVHPVLTTGLGHIMLAYGIGSLIVGSIIIRRLVKGPDL
jgi:tight adherence protein B